MKVSGFCVLFLVVGATLMFFVFSSPIDLLSNNFGDRTLLIAASRKLKENENRTISNNKGIVGKMTLDDYNPIMPFPDAAGGVHGAPIEHGTPLNPHVFPKPPPPGLPDKPGGSK